MERRWEEEVIPLTRFGLECAGGSELDVGVRGVYFVFDAIVAFAKPKRT